MNEFIKKNINIIISIFILLQPILDLLTGLCLHALNINLTIGIIIRVIFLLFICIITLFTFKKKKVLIPYLIIGLYCILYTIGIILFKESSLFKEIQNLIKVFYFPVLLVSLYSIKEEIRISKMTLFTTLFLYLILIFIPLILGIGYQTYEITKVGTLGFYNSANEISGLISILTPIMFIIIMNSKKIVPKIVLGIMYLVVILMVGTKTPLLALLITIGISILYFWIKQIMIKKYKQVIISLLILIIGLTGLIIIIPKTNFYKNIETHLDYLEVDNITEIFEDEKLIDHFIFSSRLKFMHKKAKIYNSSNTYQKLFGIGYLKDNNKPVKLIEMDYFDIFYSHGLVGFTIFFTITLYILYKVLRNSKTTNFEQIMLYTSFMLIIVLSFFTGHIITAPSVSLISIVIILSLAKKQKKELLFTGYNLELGGIENAMLNLVNRIDKEKYNITIVLEEKRGLFLDQIDKKVNVKELKVSNNDNVILRKIINALRKLNYKILNYNNYDFSCCYTTYSYSSSKLALMSSNNTAFYVHSDYKSIYNEEKDFRYFFDSRNIREYKNILFVSNENKQVFIDVYKDLEDKCKVLNNFINTDKIKKISQEEIDIKKSKNKTLLVFVGRLDDVSKKLSRQINLVKEIKELELWIVGDGPDRNRYEKEVEDKKLESRIKFIGRQKNPYKYMKEADYIILTSDYEGFPVTYLEAITLEKDIITTYPTSDDQIDIKKYGHIISKDEKEMVKQVKEIIKKKDKVKPISLDKCQSNRMIELEKIFNE